MKPIVFCGESLATERIPISGYAISNLNGSLFSKEFYYGVPVIMLHYDHSTVSRDEHDFTRTSQL